MATIRQSATKRANARERAKALREELWPDVSTQELWARDRHDGWTTIPRTMSLIMKVIDDLSKERPAGRTYLVLWCRAWDESVLKIETPQVFAFEAGFSGERAASTWKQRMKTLQELGFIDAKPGPTGEFHHVLIRNPHVAVQRLKSRIQGALYTQIYDRASEIGAEDMLRMPKILLLKNRRPIRR